MIDKFTLVLSTALKRKLRIDTSYDEALSRLKSLPVPKKEASMSVLAGKTRCLRLSFIRGAAHWRWRISIAHQLETMSIPTGKDVFDAAVQTAETASETASTTNNQTLKPAFTAIQLAPSPEAFAALCQTKAALKRLRELQYASGAC